MGVQSMKILVDRYKSDSEATLSRVTVYNENGNPVFSGFGCEDEYRVEKIRGQKRIPAGAYQCRARTWGGFYPRYCRDKRLRGIGQESGMIEIMDVPGFTDILIHIGNTEKDTAGCLLVGWVGDEDKLCVYRSAEAYAALYQIVRDALVAGALEIEFQDNDGKAA